jgi:hypothetical protein
MCVFLVLGWILGNVRWVVHRSEQIKKRKDKNPDKINKVPKQPGDFDAIGQMFWVMLVKLFTDRQPHVNKDEHSGEDMKAVQAGDREIAGEICAVRW